MGYNWRSNLNKNRAIIITVKSKTYEGYDAILTRSSQLALFMPINSTIAIHNIVLFLQPLSRNY